MTQKTDIDRELAAKRVLARAARAAKTAKAMPAIAGAATAKQDKPALIESQAGEAKLQQAAQATTAVPAAPVAPAVETNEELYTADDALRHSSIQLASLCSQVEELGKKIVEKQGELGALEARIEQIRAAPRETGDSLSPLETQAVTLKGNISDRQSELDTLEGGLTRAGETLATIQRNGAGVPETMDRLEARLDILKGDLTSKTTEARSITGPIAQATKDANRAAERLERATAAASGISTYDITQDPRYQALERKAGEFERFMNTPDPESGQVVALRGRVEALEAARDRIRKTVRAMSSVIGAVRRQAKVMLDGIDELETRANRQEESQRTVLGFIGGFEPKWLKLEGYLDSVMGLIDADLEVTLTSADPAKPGILRRPDYLEFLRTPDEGEAEPRYVAILEPLKGACSKIVRNALDSNDANARELGEKALRVLGELAGDEDTLYEIREAIYENPGSPLSSGMLRAINGIFGRAYNITHGDAEVESSAALNSTDALGQIQGAPEGSALAGMAESGALVFLSESAIMLDGLGYKQLARANAAKALAEYGNGYSLEVLANARDTEADSLVKQAFGQAHDALAQRLQEKSEG